MELWIRSQDKERLTTCNDIRVGYENGRWILEDCDCLGIYKSKERALEVLDEIQNILMPKILSYTPLTSTTEDYKKRCMKTEVVGSVTEYEIEELSTYVYKMPEE